jgi:hypothetical protein
MTAGYALQRAVYAALDADAALTGLIGPGRVFDAVPPRAALPYLLFGPVSSRGYGGLSADCEEHFLDLQIWSDAAGRAEISAIAAAAAVALENPGPLEAPYLLANLELVETLTARAGPQPLFLATIRLRAVTETAEDQG